MPAPTALGVLLRVYEVYTQARGKPSPEKGPVLLCCTGSGYALNVDVIGWDLRDCDWLRAHRSGDVFGCELRVQGVNVTCCELRIWVVSLAELLHSVPGV